MSERRRRGHCISAADGEGVKRCTEVASGNLFDAKAVSGRDSKQFPDKKRDSLRIHLSIPTLTEAVSEFISVYQRKGNLKVYQRKGKKKKRVLPQQQTFELPDEIVWEIMIRLPVESLARFKTVSKAWLAIISDPSFVRAHLQCSKQKQHRNPSHFLINPKFLLEISNADAFSTNIQFYQWCLQENMMRSTATLLYGRHFPTSEFGRVSDMAHCDGLMLLPTDTKVYVFNPATKDTIALPESQRNMMWHHRCLPVGLGLDTSTGKYKVARSFYRSRCSDPVEIVAMGMEVFTINGKHGSWRETLVDPPYPILSSQAATHYKGCLFYSIDKNNLQRPPHGLVRFSLADETFGVTPLITNIYPEVDHDDFFISEFDGELCCTYLCSHLQRVLVFTTRGVDHPKWSLRYLINVQSHFYPLVPLGSGRILLRGGNCLLGYNLEASEIEVGERFDMDEIRYLAPSQDTLGRAWENVLWFDLISYTESLVPVTPKLLNHIDTSEACSRQTS
ncbi:putative F-box protein At2g02030 isoform X4 [Panicum virgatum]|uniref:putative F-box protein At2g02030 isoform X4 n=1 Tax=Panicum virgatum TaxID=38727 RepID=UPI0019D5A66F|nr:putative F-box protein At2g02030 isoform X4 [Panicum virgatum]